MTRAATIPAGFASVFACRRRLPTLTSDRDLPLPRGASSVLDLRGNNCIADVGVQLESMTLLDMAGVGLRAVSSPYEGDGRLTETVTPTGARPGRVKPRCSDLGHGPRPCRSRSPAHRGLEHCLAEVEQDVEDDDAPAAIAVPATMPVAPRSSYAATTSPPDRGRSGCGTDRR